MKPPKIILFLFILVTTSSCAQIKSFQTGQESLANKVYLFNKTDVEISYNISIDCKKWQAEELSPLRDVLYKIDLYASIGTGEKQNVFMLKKGNSYFIAWSDSEECYVIRRKPNPVTN